MKKLKGMFCDGFDPNTSVHDMAPTHLDKDFVNYKKLSMQLGLHKDSFNFVNGTLSSQRINKLLKLKQRASVIEAVEEEEDEATQDPQHHKMNSFLVKQKQMFMEEVERDAHKHFETQHSEFQRVPLKKKGVKKTGRVSKLRHMMESE